MNHNKFFLEEVVDYTFRKYDDFRKLSIIFPNRRAGLYFQKALSKKNNKALWSPSVLTLEDFIQEYSNIKIADDVADSIILNFQLFEVIKKIQGKESYVSFDNFYYWGKILIKDFDDIDLSLKEESKIFKFIRTQKDIEESFNFLEKENYEKIKSFWVKFFPKMSVNQKNFSDTWKILSKVYSEYKKILLKNKLAYKGLVYKEFLKKIDSGIISKDQKYLFVGFSTLSNSEKKIIKYFIKNHSSMAFWDLDDYYYNDDKQEAGDAFREFSNDKTLNLTFPKSIPNNFNSSSKKFNSIGIGSQVGQCKILGSILSKKIKDKNFDQDKVLVLLPDENLLLPVLNSIPDKISNINVTMGLNLSETPLFSLVQVIYRSIKKSIIRDYKKVNYFKDILSLLSHPYIYQSDSDLSEKIVEGIRTKKVLYVDHDSLRSYSELLNYIFSNDKSIIHVLREVCSYLFNSSKNLGKLDREFIKSFLEILDKVLKMDIKFESIENQLKLINQILKMTRIPFSGEPLSGLQIMGVLESRNLDFNDVYILSMNEGDFPKSVFNISFIPFNIRKAFSLDTSDSMDKVYSYLFYRVIQRAKNITFIYNTSTSFTSKGEKSRFIKQLDSESRYSINNVTISDKLDLIKKPKLEINKTKQIIEILSNRFYKSGYMSPSGVKDFMDCSLRFYFKYVANIKEIKEVSTEILKPDFGRIAHKTLEDLYNNLIDDKGNKKINSNDFFILKNSLSGTLKNVIKRHFKLNKKNEFKLEGNNIILFDIILDYISKVISLDEKYAPFELVDLEGDRKSGYIKELKLKNNLKINISGLVDRVDKKNENYRIIDYKTGSDSKKIRNIDLLFSDRKKDRNDAIFQLLFYSILLKEKLNKNININPGLMNIREMNNKNFSINVSINDHQLKNAEPYLKDFEDSLLKILNKIFDLDQPFTQTEDTDACLYCAYKNMCSR